MENDEIQLIERKKRFLKRYRKNYACICSLETKVARIDSDMKKIRSPNYSGMPRGGTPVTVDDLLSDKMDLEERIQRRKEKGRELKREIQAEIDRLDDVRYCDVLELFMLDCLSFDDIAEELGYTRRHIERLYKEAIEALVEDN